MKFRTSAGLLVAGLVVAAVWFLLGRVPAPSPGAPETLPTASHAVERDSSGAWRVRPGLVRAAIPTGSLKIVGRVVNGEGPVAGATVTATAGEGEDVLSNMMCGCDMACGQKLLECGCGESAAQLEALVAAREGEAPPVASTTTNADGTFVLEGLAAGTLSLWAEAGERGIGVVDGAKPAEEPQAVEIALESGRWVEGVVVDERDKPLSGATVTAVDVTRSRFSDGLSGADGKFRIGPVPAKAKVRVVAAAVGRLPDSDEDRPRSDDAFVTENAAGLRLELALPRRIEGRVLRGGEGVANVEVRADGEHGKPRAKTDALGRFALEGLRSGSYEVLARDGAEAASATVDVPKGSDPAALELVLRAVSGIEGTVADRDGTAISGASIAVDQEYDGPRTTSDASGHYLLSPLDSGTYRLAVGARGHVATFVSVAVNAGALAKRDVQLERAALVSGVIVSESGEPIESARVDAAPAAIAIPIHGRTESGGRFHIDGLTPGPWDVQVSAKGFVTLEKPLTAPSENVRLVLSRGLTLQGRVVDDDGRGIPKVTVFAEDVAVREERARFGRTSPTSITDDAGRFALAGLTAGALRVEARDFTTGRHASERVELADGPPSEITLHFKGKLRIDGRVLDQDGHPVADRLVLATSDGDDETIARMAARSESYAAYMEPGTFRRAKTDAEGRFTIESLEPGKYFLRVARDSGDKPHVVRAGDEHVELRIRRRPVISGRVLADGRPLEEFTVEGDDEKSHENGYFRLETRVLPTERVRILAKGFAIWEKDVSLESGRDVALGDIVLDRGRSVSGRVVEAGSGRPIDGAVVEARADDEDEREIVMARRFRPKGVDVGVRSAADGSFRLASVSSDARVVVATRAGYRSGSAALNGDHVEITLDHGATLKVTVFDEAATPVKGGNVFVSSTTEGAYFGDTSIDDEGRATVAGLPAGSYMVHVYTRQLDPEAFPTAEATLEEHETKDLSIRARGGGVAIRVNAIRPAGKRGYVMLFALPGVTSDALKLDDQTLRKATKLRTDPDAEVATWKHAPPGPATLLGCIPTSDGLGCDALDIVVGETDQSVELRLKDPPALTYRHEKPK